MRRATVLALGALILSSFVTTVALAAGRVVDTEQRPIKDAEVCYELAPGVNGLCAKTDEKGRFDLPVNPARTLRASAPGYFPKSVPGSSAETVIVLHRSAALLVKLRDARSGDPIAEGQVWVVNESARIRGPFPVNEHGVHVRTLPPGRVMLRATAPGHLPYGGHAVVLVAGERTEVELLLEAAPSQEQP